MSEFMQNIGWENTIEAWHLVVLFILLSLASFWEIRKLKPRKVGRTIALLLAFISLYIIYLSPFSLIEKPIKSVLLFGQHISENTVDSLSDEFDLTGLHLHENSKFHEVGSENITSISELEYQIDTAFVYGYFPQLNPVHYKFRKDIEIQKGLYINYPKSIVLGDSLSISIQNLENKELNISALIGNDSISKPISAKGQGRISILPKSTGYVISEISTNNGNYHFAINVEEKEQYVFQILASAPDFEWKFFSDYLKSKEHSLYQKTQISKGKFKSSFFNWHDSLQFNRGVAKDLKVLFSDANTWEDLAPNVKNSYVETLKENHGSLIFRTNPNSQIKLDLDLSKSTNIFSTSNNLLEQNNYNYLQFNNIYELDEVAKKTVFRRVTPELIYGVINFQNSYKLKLSGKDQEFKQVWSPFFNDLIRRSSEIFYDKSKWAVQHHPFFLRIWSSGELQEISIFNLQNDTIKLNAKPDVIFPERKHLIFYPKNVGWHFIHLKNQRQSIPFYVHSEELLNQSEFLSIYNYDYLNYLNFEVSDIKKKEKKYNQESLTLWFFLLFLLSIAYLWIEDKIT